MGDGTNVGRTMRVRKQGTVLGLHRVAGDRRNSVRGRNSRDVSTEQKFSGARWMESQRKRLIVLWTRCSSCISQVCVYIRHVR